MRFSCLTIGKRKRISLGTNRICVLTMAVIEWICWGNTRKGTENMWGLGRALLQWRIPVQCPWIFLGAPLKFNGAPGNIQGNLTGMVTSHERYGASNHRQLDCYCNNFVKLTAENKSRLKITGRLWVNSIFGFAYTVSKARIKYLQVRRTSYFWALWLFQMLKGPLFQTKLHLLNNVLLSGFQSSRGALKFTE